MIMRILGILTVFTVVGTLFIAGMAAYGSFHRKGIVQLSDGADLHRIVCTDLEGGEHAFLISIPDEVPESELKYYSEGFCHSTMR
jgi:hypothetical protein